MKKYIVSSSTNKDRIKQDNVFRIKWIQSKICEEIKKSMKKRAFQEFTSSSAHASDFAIWALGGTNTRCQTQQYVKSRRL